MAREIQVGETVGSIVKKPDEVALFAFSAATWNPHRIHFDRDYARSEGHKDVVVHGSLQANWLLEALYSWCAACELRSFSFRNVGTAFVHETFHVGGVIEEVQSSVNGHDAIVRLTVEGPVGATTVGTASVHIADKSQATGS